MGLDQTLASKIVPQPVGWVERSDTHRVTMIEWRDGRRSPQRSCRGQLPLDHQSGRQRDGFRRRSTQPTGCDLPDGQISEFAVQSPLQKYFCFHTPQITSRTFRIPSHTEGRFAIVTDVGHGMRWTRQRFACDGIAGRIERSVSDHRHADERCCCVRRSRVVLTPRRWRQVLRRLSRPDRA